MSAKEDYKKMDPVEHVLHRPDMYVGSVRARKVSSYVYGEEGIERRVIEYSPALLRIFIEPLSNVIDNCARSKKSRNSVTKIEVDIDEKTGRVTFKNDGNVIPVSLHSKEKCYNHSLIFGHLLTSSNYNDEEERYDISGTNGLGIKLTSIFSTIFEVKGTDPKNKKSFFQSWSDNMRECTEPVVGAYSLKKGYTQVSYVPDFSRFKKSSGRKLVEYGEGIISLYKKFVVDMAMITRVPVFLNGGKNFLWKSFAERQDLFRC